MERNRRIAKAYARKHSLTVNGSEDEYLDGTSLGLNSFDNPDRDAKTRHIKQFIGHGIRIKITPSGDLIVRRLSKSNVFVYQHSSINQSAHEINGSDLYGPVNDESELYGALPGINSTSSQANCLNEQPYSSSSSFALFSRFHQQKVSAATTNGISKRNKQQDLHGKTIDESSSSGVRLNSTRTARTSSSSGISSSSSSTCLPLDFNRWVKIFDMSEYKMLLERESHRPVPNRKLLESQCISVISFVLDDNKILNLPSWIMIINIVAFDLLRSEFGLIPNQHHHSTTLANEQDLFTSPLAERLITHQSGRDETDEDFINEETNKLVYNPRKQHQKEHQNGRYLNQTGKQVSSRARQLEASKKAFANAAALGAYNRTNNQHLQASAHPGDCWLVGSNLNPVTELELTAKSVVKEDKNLRGQISKSAVNLNQAQHDAQQLSSSSGFNSHCSSQNDSSIASSSSNIAVQAQVTPTDISGNGKVVNLENHRPEAAGSAPIEDGPGDFEKELSAELSRGKRVRKLPEIHSDWPVKNTRTGVPIGSAHPTKANLILVSPTGLSPPLPKRMGSSSKLQSLKDTSEFNCIKLIDENGQCSVLKQDRRQVQALPAGIPAHAQLASPATQRHILKYLQSANINNSTDGHRIPARQQPVASKQLQTSRYQRPLPIVPGSSQKILSHSQRELRDESLYYSGLQARVPNRYRAPAGVRTNGPPAMQAPQYPVSTSAINAILSEFKRNSGNKNNNHLHYYKPHLSKQQSSLTNLHSENYNSYQSYNPNPTLLFPTSQPKSGKKATSRPLMNFFKSSTSGKLQSAELPASHYSSFDNQNLDPKSRAKFLSADNLNKRQTPIDQPKSAHSSILSHLGLPNLRSRMSKSKQTKS